MSPELELTRSLARAMLMADLLTHRLAAAYALSESTEIAEELAVALEAESLEMKRNLEAAQNKILRLDGSAA
jgi:hypothetical protein